LNLWIRANHATALIFLSEKLTTPFFFSQKKSGKKEKGFRQLADTYQDKFSIRRGGSICTLVFH